MCKTSLKKHQNDLIHNQGEFAGCKTLKYCLKNLEEDIADIKGTATKVSENIARTKQNIDDQELERLKELQEEEEILLRCVRALYKKRIHAECPSAITLSLYDQRVKSKIREIETIGDKIQNPATNASLSEILERKLKQEFQSCIGESLGENLEKMKDVVKSLEDDDHDLEKIALESPNFQALADLARKFKEGFK